MKRLTCSGHIFGIITYFLAACLIINCVDAESAQEWTEKAKEELRIALQTKPIEVRPKNVIFFLGDGMGIATLTAARIYKGQREGRTGEEGFLAFERFPHVGLSKTYADNTQTTDSAAAATAFLCGVKTNRGVLGVNSNVKQGNFSAVPENEISSIFSWAQNAGKATGIVTTTSVTHASPAAAYAHSASRSWESDKSMPQEAKAFSKDIARQLIEDTPGKNLNVIMGGGRLNFLPSSAIDLPSNQSGNRGDDRDLLQLWRQMKSNTSEGSTSHIVTDNAQLSQLNASNTTNVLGLFSRDHMEYELLRNRSAATATEPPLRVMTRKALEILQKYPNGFFLMVEAGKIDSGHHSGMAKRALHDTLEFEAAVEEALKMVSTNDTLILVTADHSHTLGLAGFAERGTSILKFGGVGDDQKPYLTLSYANGPGHVKEWPRRNLTEVDTEADDFRQDALVPRSSETHGGEDVAIYATGPFAHLFHSLHEQNYIAVALDYAACYRNQTPAHCIDLGNGSIQFRLNALVTLTFVFSYLMVHI
ncbi:alkaline phosphatase-like [Paramacrobiotus metropolitanus]|uniref:alkaline phosphatase-like n=1 Tax=Paramacrobiotus metropolitanus TaxID=2943436 RepID=UPI002445AF99|nr:alkaline phosphatase-like [Paramacrobiotus metropolitanus]